MGPIEGLLPTDAELELEWLDDELVLCCIGWAPGRACEAAVCSCNTLEASMRAAGEKRGGRKARRGLPGSEARRDE